MMQDTFPNSCQVGQDLSCAILQTHSDPRGANFGQKLTIFLSVNKFFEQRSCRHWYIFYVLTIESCVPLCFFIDTDQNECTQNQILPHTRKHCVLVCGRVQFCVHLFGLVSIKSKLTHFSMGEILVVAKISTVG